MICFVFRHLLKLFSFPELVAWQEGTRILVTVARPAPLGTKGFLCPPGVALLREELTLVEQKVLLGRSSVVSKCLWLQTQVLQFSEVLLCLNKSRKS